MRISRLAALTIAASLCTFGAEAGGFYVSQNMAAKEPVDMLLCLAADASASVSDREFWLQRNGHAAAIADPQTINAITRGLHGKIAVSYVEWARPDQQFLSVGWHRIDGATSADTFAAKLRTSPPPPWIKFPIRNTSTGDAIRYCLKQFRDSPMTSNRLVVDLSSNGTSNVGVQPYLVRDTAVGQGVTINVLALTGSLNDGKNFGHTQPEDGLVHYFENNVMGGFGSFVETVDGYTSFGEVLRRKFLLEIASSQ